MATSQRAAGGSQPLAAAHCYRRQQACPLWAPVGLKPPSTTEHTPALPLLRFRALAAPAARARQWPGAPLPPRCRSGCTEVQRRKRQASEQDMLLTGQLCVPSKACSSTWPTTRHAAASQCRGRVSSHNLNLLRAMQPEAQRAWQREVNLNKREQPVSQAPHLTHPNYLITPGWSGTIRCMANRTAGSRTLRDMRHSQPS